MYSVSNYVYKTESGHPLKLSIFRKSGNQSFEKPLILIFKGGSWKYKIRTDIPDFFKTTMEILMDNGYSIGVFEYRVCSMNNIYFPDIIKDCRDLVKYIFNNREFLKLYTNEFVFLGHSAGGQLAYMLAFGPNEYNIASLNININIRALVLTNTPFYLYKANIGNGYMSKEVSRLFQKSNIEKLKGISPITYVSNIDKPIMVICSKNDFIHSSMQALCFLDECDNQNKECEYLCLNCIDHDFFIDGKIDETHYEMMRMRKSLLNFIEKNCSK